MTWFLPHIMEGPINRSLEPTNRSMHILQGQKPSDAITLWQVIHHLIDHFKLLATRTISTTTLRINIWPTLIESMVGQATLNSDIPTQPRYRFHHRIIMSTGILSSEISLFRNEVNKKRYHFLISKKLWTATEHLSATSEHRLRLAYRICHIPSSLTVRRWCICVEISLYYLNLKTESSTR